MSNEKDCDTTSDMFKVGPRRLDYADEFCG